LRTRHEVMWLRGSSAIAFLKIYSISASWFA
jgi:hypothetical protein